MLARKSIAENAKLHNFSLKEVENDFLDILEGSVHESRDDFARDVAVGLGSEKKFLSPKYFYDSIGSELFVKITQTKEYYPTRTEKSILKTYASEIVDKCTDIKYFVELGSGSSDKTTTLLEEFFERDNSPTYIPIDLSDIIIESSEKLIDKYVFCIKT
jgi:L-histidine N-alpha-methyltransferase